MLKQFLIFLSVMTLAPVYAQVIDYARDGFAPLQPQINYAQPKNTSKMFNKLNRLERKIFNRSFNEDSIENRIVRLEEQIFGTIQSGDLVARYNILQKAVPRYRSYTSQSVDPYCVAPNATNWRGLAGSLGNFFNNSFMGYPTGITPPIMPMYNTYTPDFYRGNFSNRGWDIQNNNYGAGSKVHILD